MKQLEQMKKTLMGCVSTQMLDLKNTDTKELGEAIDMIKDLSEAIYYCTIIEAMKGENGTSKYQQQQRYQEMPERMYYGDMGHSTGHNGNNNNSSNGGNTRSSSSTSRHGNSRSYYQEYEYPMTDMRDPREGRSYMSRRMYMESKDAGRDKLTSIKDLEHYMSELSEDITEMIEKSSPEEKQILQKKLTTLAQKIVNG